MSEGITGYQAEYFVPVARDTLDALLAKEGFSYVGDHRGVTAYWSDGPRFFRVGYLPETKPRYELLLGVGEHDGSPLEPKSSRNSIGVWRLLPPETAPAIADWQFDSPEMLRQELLRAWNEAIIPHVIPLWAQDGRLAGLIAEHNDELNEADKRSMDDRLLRHARAEFDAGRFAEAVDAYDELSDEQLTPADRKRLEIARRRR